jgi:NTE family protein
LDLKLETKDFTSSKEIEKIITELKIKIPNKIFSDVIDDQGHQYIDLVQEGGGVLGFALLGYTYVLEQIGIRFFSLGGTSAGAINTLLLAAIDNIEMPKTEKIIDTISNQDLFDLVDGSFMVKKLFKSVRNDSSIFSKIFWFLSTLPHLLKYKGLNPGNYFLKWISAILNTNNIHSTSELLDKQNYAGIKMREGIKPSSEDLHPKLKIITAEITTETRVIFPEMNYLFWDNPGNVNPADYIRASMSIPIFFHPFIVNTGSGVKKSDWETEVKYFGPVPKEACFVDGGIMSNFPIDVFHNYYIVPRLPTFGVKLGDDRDSQSSISSMPQFLMSIFYSSSHVLDYQFLLQNNDYEKLITKVDIGDHNWLDFSMSDIDKLDLFIRGANAASEFLINFNWEKYKEIRAGLIKQHEKD